MKIKEFEHNLEDGFAWIVLDNDNDNDMVVQCCLEQGSGLPAKPQISQSDCGHDWGICADANAAAFEKWGADRCMASLFSEAKAANIEIIK